MRECSHETATTQISQLSPIYEYQEDKSSGRNGAFCFKIGYNVFLSAFCKTNRRFLGHEIMIHVTGHGKYLSIDILLVKLGLGECKSDQ